MTRHAVQNLIYGVSLPEELYPPSASRYKAFYCITSGQECGIFYSWYVLLIFLLCIHAHLVSRADVSARTSGISGSCQQKFKTWQEAHDVYQRSYEKGAVKATPLRNGPFDPHCNREDNLVDAFARVIL